MDWFCWILGLDGLGHGGPTVDYQLQESLMLDPAMGTKVAGDWPDWTATVGLTWVG